MKKTMTYAAIEEQEQYELMTSRSSLHRMVKITLFFVGELLLYAAFLFWLFNIVSIQGFSAEKAECVQITSSPVGARIEQNGNYLGDTPYNWCVGNWALNVRKSSLFSKHLNAPITLTISKDGYNTKETVITKEWIWNSFNGRNHYAYWTITNTSFNFDLESRGAVLTNADIVNLHSAGLSDELVIEKIAHQDANFSVEFADLLTLHNAGVSDAVIKAMMNRAPVPKESIPSTIKPPEVIQ